MAKAFPTRTRRKNRISPEPSLDLDAGSSKKQQPRTKALLGHVVDALDDATDRFADAAERTADFVGGHGNINLIGDGDGDGPERVKSKSEDGAAQCEPADADQALEPASTWLPDLVWGVGFLCYVLAPLALFGYCMFQGLVAADTFQQSQAAAICIWTFSIVMMTISHF